MRRRHYDATEEESDIRDGSHGLAMWGLGVLLGALVAFSGLTAAVSTATTAASNVAAGAASAAVGSADEVVDSGELVVDRLLRGGGPAPEGASPADQRAEVSRILLSSAASGTLDPADRQYLVDTVAARTGIPPEEAQQRVDQIYAQAQELETQARAAADRARKIAVIGAFITAASLLIAGAGALFRRRSRRQPPRQEGHRGGMGSPLALTYFENPAVQLTEARPGFENVSCTLQAASGSKIACLALGTRSPN